ncbi:hypothetical protein BKA81DRAFT_345223 [Phyllosticta paracitricarpa]
MFTLPFIRFLDPNGETHELSPQIPNAAPRLLQTVARAETLFPSSRPLPLHRRRRRCQRHFIRLQPHHLRCPRRSLLGDGNLRRTPEHLGGHDFGRVVVVVVAERPQPAGQSAALLLLLPLFGAGRREARRVEVGVVARVDDAFGGRAVGGADHVDGGKRRRGVGRVDAAAATTGDCCGTGAGVDFG